MMVAEGRDIRTWLTCLLTLWGLQCFDCISSCNTGSCSTEQSSSRSLCEEWLSFRSQQIFSVKDQVPLFDCAGL